MRCPGQDMRFWKPGDIFDVQCPKCGKKVEFFRDEVKRKCKCGHEIINPNMDFGCAAWCQYAEQCIGVVPDEVKHRQKKEERDRLKERIGLEMKKYLGTDFRRLKHALRVAWYAEQILKMEGGNPLVVLGAAYLHDIGIHEAEKKYGRDAEEHQEREGVPLARGLLERLNVEAGWAEEICDLIGHRRHPREEETLNFQVFYEADRLAHLEEEAEKTDRPSLDQVSREAFETVTGKRLAEKLYGRDDTEKTSPPNERGHHEELCR